MFRATFKKKRKAVTRLRSDSDDEEGHEVVKEEAKSSTLNKTKQKSKKKKGLVVRSFDVGEGDDEVLQKNKKSKDRKRKRGLGFGGANVVVHDEDELEHSQQQNDTTTTTANVYGKDALEKLKQEQAYKAPVVEDTQEMETDSIPQPENKELHAGLGDYIPLNEKEPNMILTGDEALDFENKRDSKEDDDEDIPEQFRTVVEDSNFLNDAVDQQQAEESTAWEAEIARRAGIAGNSKRVETSGDDGRSTASSTSALSLAKLRSQIQSTVSHLETQQADVDRAFERRKVELNQTKDELVRQQKELKESGEALENYQQLREQLTFWTGALRDLQCKVQPIQDALLDLDADIANGPQWREWEDDMCAILHQAGVLDRVLGRQPSEFNFEQTTTYVDEFGRDVKSQHTMNREKRMRRRQEIEEMRGHAVEEDDPDAFLGQDDKESFQERRKALAKALEIALEELEDEYTRITKLAMVFHDWQNSYSEDFKQCFANLSFGDLASVLVQVELCKSRTSDQGWIADGNVNGTRGDDFIFPWMQQLSATESLNDKSTKQPADDLVDRVLEKTYIPLLSSVLDKGAYSVLSEKQSQEISGLFGKLSTWHSKTHNQQFEFLRRNLFEYIKKSLHSIAIPMLNSEAKIATEDDSKANQDLQYAMRGATEGQLRRLNAMLLNIITYWSPYFSGDSGSDVIEALLDFTSTKYLFLLSSLRTRSGNIVDASFSRLWEALRETKWLDQPGRMLQAAPIRAAATAFHVS